MGKACRPGCTCGRHQREVKVRPFRERVLSKIVVDLDGPHLVDDAPCWLWTGPGNGAGYGIISRGRASEGKVAAHRAVYELLLAPIPEGLTLDHLCRNRICVNPAHMEPVTMRVNLLRGEGPSARAARATHCPQGHEYSPDNTYRSKRGRECKKCKVERYHAQKKNASCH
jgi:hypothetical protein